MAEKLTPEALQRLADEDLMTLVDRRDPDAFAVLYDRHGGAAYSLAHRIVGDPAIAEDVTQEAFISVWRSGARFEVLDDTGSHRNFKPGKSRYGRRRCSQAGIVTHTESAAHSRTTVMRR